MRHWCLRDSEKSRLSNLNTKGQEFKIYLFRNGAHRLVESHLRFQSRVDRFPRTLLFHFVLQGHWGWCFAWSKKPKRWMTQVGICISWMEFRKYCYRTNHGWQTWRVTLPKILSQRCSHLELSESSRIMIRETGLVVAWVGLNCKCLIRKWTAGDSC